MGWKCIAIHWFVLQRRELKLYCRCSIVLQYSGVQRVQKCIAIQFSGQQVCIAIQTVL